MWIVHANIMTKKASQNQICEPPPTSLEAPPGAECQCTGRRGGALCEGVGVQGPGGAHVGLEKI